MKRYNVLLPINCRLPSRKHLSGSRQLAPNWSLAIHGGAGGISPGPSRIRSPQNRSHPCAKLWKPAVIKYFETARAPVSTPSKQQSASWKTQAYSMLAAAPSITMPAFAELDASIMNGKDLKSWRRSGPSNTSPIQSTSHALSWTAAPHVFMVAYGAETFAKEQGIELVPSSYFQTDWRHQELLLEQEKAPLKRVEPSEPSHLTHTATWQQGHPPAALPTNTLARVGDSPVIGAGTYAKKRGCAQSRQTVRVNSSFATTPPRAFATASSSTTKLHGKRQTKSSRKSHGTAATGESS